MSTAQITLYDSKGIAAKIILTYNRSLKGEVEVTGKLKDAVIEELKLNHNVYSPGEPLALDDSNDWRWLVGVARFMVVVGDLPFKRFTMTDKPPSSLYPKADPVGKNQIP